MAASTFCIRAAALHVFLRRTLQLAGLAVAPVVPKWVGICHPLFNESLTRSNFRLRGSDNDYFNTSRKSRSGSHMRRVMCCSWQADSATSGATSTSQASSLLFAPGCACVARQLQSLLSTAAISQRARGGTKASFHGCQKRC